MSRLLLKFGNSILKETEVGQEVLIGRSSHCGLVIDNQAVSHEHARVYSQHGRLMLEDFGSLNGTFVNSQRVKSVVLKSGDSVSIGKHTILVEETFEPRDSEAGFKSSAAPAKPKLDETVMLDTKLRSDLVQRLAAAGETSQIAPKRLKVPTLVVRKGKTDRKEYVLTDRLTVIGKSAMATVRLTRWFAPKAVAQIKRRENNSYYIGEAGRVHSVNGQPVDHTTKLVPGDIIEVDGVQHEFQCRE